MIRLLRYLLFILGTFSFWCAAPAFAELKPIVQATGQITVSVDAEGNNNAAGGTLQVTKPPGATVRSAHLFAASNFGRVIADGDVSLAGTPITWDQGAFNNAGTFSPTFFHNTYADVTGILKPLLDSASSGLSHVHVTEAGTNTIDGTILAVVFDDPGQDTTNSVILLFGGQDTLGDTFSLNFAEPLHLGGDFVLDMGLGISFGFQGTSGTSMVSVIDVNNSRLTSSAGGEDDGGGFNGGLITVGGIGDDNDNPPPFASSSGFRTDDERYTLVPFVDNGDESLIVETINPTDDDNIFFAYFQTSLPSAILPPVPPPGSRTVVGNINPGLPTLVLTHGLTNEDMSVNDLWTGTRERQAATLVSDYLAESSRNANVVQYVWEEAFQSLPLGVPTKNGYLEAQRNVVDAGTRLASELHHALGSNYSEPIHFIGHSLGTAVNAYAASAFLNTVQTVHLAQFTALDRPHHIDDIPFIGPDEESTYGYDSDFFTSILPDDRDDLNLRIDNYYALDGGFEAGVGDIANGPVYNHPNLVEPNDLDDEILNDEGFDNNHSGVQQWYRWTIAPRNPFPSGESVCDGDEFADGKRPFGFDESLNPCQQGWYWSLNADPSSFPETNGAPRSLSPDEPLVLTQSREFGCEVTADELFTRIVCSEASSPFAVLEAEIPEDADFLSFDYRFLNVGDGDYLALLINDQPLWVLSGSSVLEEGTLADSGLIPLGNLVGNRRVTIALYGVGAANAEVEVTSLATQMVLTFIPIKVDINPESSENVVNVRSKGVIPVAILTTSTADGEDQDFDATEVEPGSLRFGPGAAAIAHNGHLEDVDQDGDADLLVHVSIQDTGLTCESTTSTLAGELRTGQPIQGTDTISPVGCR